MERIPLWRSEIFKLWIQYMAAGVAAIPAGVLYALLLQHSVPQKQAFSPSICVGVVLGLAAWIYVGRRLRRPTLRRVVEVKKTAVIATAWVSYDGGVEYLYIQHPLFTSSLETRTTGTDTLVTTIWAISPQSNPA
jgi:hypothetical protein